MPRVCDTCGKGPRFGHNVSHAHNLTRRVWLPNLKRVRVAAPGGSRHMRVCTRCLRSGRVGKAIA